MLTARKAKGQQKLSTDKSPASFKVDLVFSGPLLFVPEVRDGAVASLEVYAPCNGHPVGAAFLPGTYFSDADLDAIEGDNWPESSSFSLLDPHSYLIRLTQATGQAPFPLGSIPESNHKVRAGRKLSGDWHIAFQVIGQISQWSSHRLHTVSEGMYYGSDRPTGPTVATLQRLSYLNVVDAEIHGLGPQQTEYLHANSSRGGTLIIEGETPYQSTLLHERQAIDALAKLAGLNLHLTTSAPIGRRTMPQGHILDCLNSVIAV
jgi:hypothetical protein